MPLESAASALLLVLVITRCLPPGATVDHNFCTELSQKSLTNILGQAFNPRYMSIDPPDSPRSEHPLGGHKRSPNDIPFYADNDLVSVGELPAWETNHLSYFEQRADEGGAAANGGAGEEVALQRQRRLAFVDRITSKTEMFKSRPWECTSRINWIDLGANYFPRYIRSIECIAKKCWYGHFDCKPKSFTIKVLHRKISSCIRVNDKLVMIAAEKFAKEYTELWIWKEVAVNFCCDCVMTY